VFIILPHFPSRGWVHPQYNVIVNVLIAVVTTSESSIVQWLVQIIAVKNIVVVASLLESRSLPSAQNSILMFYTPVSIKILVLHDIYSSGITHAISSLCRDNLGRHPTTLIDRPTHRCTSPAAHLSDDLLLA
jgi:hypothetical protein